METRLGLPLESSGGEATGLRLLRLHRLPAGPALKRGKTINRIVHTASHGISVCSSSVQKLNHQIQNVKPCTSTKYLGSAWARQICYLFFVKLGKVTALILLAICQKCQVAMERLPLHVAQPSAVAAS